MNKKIKVILVSVFLIVVIVVGSYFLFLNKDRSGNTAADELFGWKYPVAKFPTVGSISEKLAYSEIRDPGGIPRGLPVRLFIPVIGVDSAIEDALITPDGRMDVPAGSVNVAWFSLGPNPGQVGSAVIGGHFGIWKGVPFVFYNLDKLKVGDKIYILNDKGDTLAFIVRSIGLFDRNDDATNVFTSEDGLAHLNLITCEGIWNRVNDTYPERRVIFADAMTVEESEVKTNVPISFVRSLDVGSIGEDVVRLQIILEKKGLLNMPPGVAKGFFGELTRVAVAKYQAGVGLPAIGTFGPLTRARLISDQALVGVVPALPSTATVVFEWPIFIQVIIYSVKSLFGSLVDGLITSGLLVLIIFMIFKIIRRRKNSR